MTTALLLLALSLASPAAPDTGVRRLSLAEAVSLAQRNAPAVVHARGQSRSADAAVRAAYGAFLPSVSLSAGANRQLPARAGQVQVVNGQVVAFSSEPWSYSTGVTANLGLFAGGERLFTLQQSRATADGADVNVGEQENLATLAVKQQYYDVLASAELEDAAAAQLRQAEQQFAMSVLHLKARTVTRSDSLRSEILVHNARLATTQAGTSRAQANASLTRIVGTPYPVTAAGADSLDDAALPLDEGTLRSLALAGPAVRHAEAARRAARAALHVVWAGYLPSLDAAYSRGGSGTADHFAVSGVDLAYSGALRFTVSMPVFDQFQRASRSASARAALADADANVRDAGLAALESVTQWLGAYRAAGERVELQAATLEAATEDLREHQEQYDVGSTSMLDVMTSRTTLDQARHDLIQARYDRRIARAQLEALIGRSF